MYKVLFLLDHPYIPFATMGYPGTLRSFVGYIVFLCGFILILLVLVLLLLLF